MRRIKIKKRVSTERKSHRKGLLKFTPKPFLSKGNMKTPKANLTQLMKTRVKGQLMKENASIYVSSTER